MKKFFVSPCFACSNCQNESSSWDEWPYSFDYCEAEGMGHVGNLKNFPMMEKPKNCKHFFYPDSNTFDGIYWDILLDMDFLGVGQDMAHRIASNLANFERRIRSNALSLLKRKHDSRKKNSKPDHI